MENETIELNTRKPSTRFSIERASGKKDPSRFPAVLASDGEASDGDILSIAGMRVPDSMPMLFRHQSMADVPILGRIIEPLKSKENGRERLRVTGAFDLEGEPTDPLLAIRKGFASLVANGTLDAMSVRWDPVFGKFIRRSDLPSEHSAFVDIKTAQGPEVFGLYFEQSVAREGSVVAIGADPEALMGRARASESLFEEAYFTLLAGRIGRGEAREHINPDQRLLFDAMTKVVVEAIASEAKATREAFTLQLTQEDESDIGESQPERREAEASKTKTSREVHVETQETDTKKAEPRRLDIAELRCLISETASESAARRIGQALGRLTQ